MNIPTRELIDEISDRTLETFMQCMLDQTEPMIVMKLISGIIKEELDKHGFPYTEEQVRELAAMLGIQFLETIDKATEEMGYFPITTKRETTLLASNDEEYLQ
jgi:hypothetical protein